MPNKLPKAGQWWMGPRAQDEGVSQALWEGLGARLWVSRLALSFACQKRDVCLGFAVASVLTAHPGLLARLPAGAFPHMLPAHILPACVKPLGAKAEMPCIVSVSSTTWLLVPLFSVRYPRPFVSPKPREVSLVTNICMCGSWGPERASHLPKDTQLLCKEVSPDLSSPGQVLLALKS